MLHHYFVKYTDCQSAPGCSSRYWLFPIRYFMAQSWLLAGTLSLMISACPIRSDRIGTPQIPLPKQMCIFSYHVQHSIQMALISAWLLKASKKWLFCQALSQEVSWCVLIDCFWLFELPLITIFLLCIMFHWSLLLLIICTTLSYILSGQRYKWKN